jgi:hypothetical protein
MDTNDARRQIHLSIERNIGETQFIGKNLRKDSGVMDVVQSPDMLSVLVNHDSSSSTRLNCSRS